ncbi:MAG TPA: lysophospholipase [Chthoniobacteraceae bacterium]|nr:lysophospholipase [Chthoniobacteraceae bacterium]
MPATIHFSETFLPAGGNFVLFLRSPEVAGKVKADVLLTHGMGEHGAKYNHVAEFFARNGYRLCSYDLRGHGRSHGRRGHINRYGELLDDLETVLHHHQRDGAPPFLFGHSLGGQITLNYLIQRRPRVLGAIITSPLLQLGFRPSRMKVILAKLMLRLWPSFTQSGPNDRTLLSHDLEFLNSLPGQELLHPKISARMYHEILAGAANVLKNPARLECPLLFIQGAEDSMVSVAATKAFFEEVAATDKTLRIHDGMRHETQNEIGREKVLAQMVEWMDARLSAAACS